MRFFFVDIVCLFTQLGNRIAIKAHFDTRIQYWMRFIFLNFLRSKSRLFSTETSGMPPQWSTWKRARITRGKRYCFYILVFFSPHILKAKAAIKLYVYLSTLHASSKREIIHVITLLWWRYLQSYHQWNFTTPCLE